VPFSALTVAFVLGVTPGKWARVWAERRPGHPLTLLPLEADAALSALDDGTADLALVRLPVDTERWHAIALYEENAVVVAPKDHAIEALDSMTLADLTGESVLDAAWGDAVALVAANVGVALMPQSVARALSRRDVVARPVTDAPTTRVALVWRRDRDDPLIDEFVGIVRGRTANSSRGATDEQPDPAPAPRQRPARPATPSAKAASRAAQNRRRSGGRGR
jgi:hypothetical protein